MSLESLPHTLLDSCVIFLWRGVPVLVFTADFVSQTTATLAVRFGCIANLFYIRSLSKMHPLSKILSLCQFLEIRRSLRNEFDKFFNFLNVKWKMISILKWKMIGNDRKTPWPSCFDFALFSCNFLMVGCLSVQLYVHRCGGRGCLPSTPASSQLGPQRFSRQSSAARTWCGTWWRRPSRTFVHPAPRRDSLGAIHCDMVINVVFFLPSPVEC